MSQQPQQPFSPAASAETRRRLLEAASIVFAEEGFYAATVREICRRAGANVAAINYHFGDKEQLYREVMRQGLREANKRYPITRESLGAANTPPEQRLRNFIATLMRRIFDQDQAATYGKLMARELIEPTPAFEVLLEETVRPNATILHEIVSDLLGPQCSAAAVRHAASSVIGQCLFYRHCRPMLTSVFPEQRFEPGDIERLADHIANFSLGGVRAMSPPAGAEAPHKKAPSPKDAK